ncbi:MAG: gamma-glutamyltransferase [Gammaproteobacteria bacterium]|nr:MAG: gamma-glutamyltransferase [Gammaproteobacteria bacterium]
MISFFLTRILLPVCLLASLSLYASDHPRRHAIASAHPLATKAGMEILDEGGNAFDAAVTVAAVLSVVVPYSSGMGGGGFWLLHDAVNGKQVMVDGRERAPFAAHENMYLDESGDVIQGLSIKGALSAGIPGQVAALIHINQKYGSKPLARLFRPAIKLARKGFPVNPEYQRLASFRLAALQEDQRAAEIFLDDNEIPEIGYVLKQSDLAGTLEKIANTRGEDFYSGDTAKRMVAAVRSAGGIWTLGDLAEYRVIEREPVTFGWREMKITSASLPSSGGVVLATMFNILKTQAWDTLDDMQRVHLVIEAMRRAYRDRAVYLGDSDHVEVPVDYLVSQQHANLLAGDIRLDMATASHSLKKVPVKPSEGQDTTHYSILDRDGNRVAATLSLNYPFGSGFVAGDTGVLLNDEMDDFSSRPGAPNAYGLVGGQANAIAPGKRMLSSMSPTFVETKEKIAILGTPGGSRIITMVMQVILALASEKNAGSIVDQPRYHHQYLPDRVQLEPGALSEEVRQDLSMMGHELKLLERPFGNMQVIIKDKKSGRIDAASDQRGIGLSVVE